MTTFSIKPSKLRGSITVPPSKSHTLRALFFALMAKGTSRIRHYLHSPDTDAMIDAISQLGAQVERSQDVLQVLGVAGKLLPPKAIIDAGNSGQVLRFIGALGAIMPHKMTITGDESIRCRRPMKPLLSALEQLGATTTVQPLSIRGPITGARAVLDGRDSQPVSALLMASAFLPQTTVIEVINPGERPWIDLTLFWLKKMGVEVVNENYTSYVVKGSASYDGFGVVIPGDWSAAAYPIVGALITHSELKIHRLDPNDVQGDKKFLDLLSKMGAQISWEKDVLSIQSGALLSGIQANLNDCIDMVTILPVLACFATSQTKIMDVEMARFKESDRIRAIVTELKKMGANIEEHQDGLTVFPSRLKGAELESYADHRMSLALSIAAMAADGSSRIHGVEAIAKSYPHFKDDFIHLGALID
jgi:3-phosphoshikimate 1-carboxyvinyltransferase